MFTNDNWLRVNYSPAWFIASCIDILVKDKNILYENTKKPNIISELNYSLKKCKQISNGNLVNF